MVDLNRGVTGQMTRGLAVCYPPSMITRRVHGNPHRTAWWSFNLPPMVRIQCHILSPAPVGYLRLGLAGARAGAVFGTEPHDEGSLTSHAEDLETPGDFGCDHSRHAQAHLTCLLSYRPIPPLAPPFMPQAHTGPSWRSHGCSPPTGQPKHIL